MGDQGKKDRELVFAAQRQQAQRALGLCEERLRRLTDALLDGDIEKDLFEERKAALLSERASLRDAIERPDPRDPFDAVLEKLELGNRAQQGHETVDDDQKIKTVELISSNLVADGKELGIEPRFPFSVVAKWRLSHFGGPCWGSHRIDDEPEHSDPLTTQALFQMLQEWKTKNHNPEIYSLTDTFPTPPLKNERKPEKPSGSTYYTS